MDRLTEPHFGAVGPTRPEWDWFNSSKLFVMDPVSDPAVDMSDWCHSPFYGVQQRLGVVPFHNEAGPAIRAFNNTNVNSYGDGIMWEALDQGMTTGTNPAQTNWTIALGIDKIGGHGGILDIFQIEQFAGKASKLSYNTATGLFAYYFDDWPRLYASAPGLSAQQTFTTLVITKSHPFNVGVMYVNGQLATGGPGTAVNLSWFARLRLFYLGLKQPDCWGGTIGPFIISRHAWNPGEIAQWHADPWGFLRTDAHPTPYVIDALEFDTRTRRAVDFDVQTRRAMTYDARTRRAVDFDARSRRAVDFDVRTRRAVDFDVRTRPRGD